MKNFETKRFCRVLKLDIYQNARTYLNIAGGCFIAHLISQLLTFYFSNIELGLSYTPAQLEDFLHGAQMASLTLCCMCTFFFFILGASMLWNNLKTKEMRISYLMLPATNLEKYLSRLFLYTIGILLINVLAFFVADLIRMVMFCRSGMAMGLVFPYYIDLIKETAHSVQLIMDSSKAPNIAFTMQGISVNTLVSLLLTYPATFMFGSVIFRRHAFVKTWLCLTVLGIISTLFTFSYVVNGQFINFTQEHAATLVYLNIAWELAWSCIFIWLSYYLFVKMNVIRRKLF